MALTKKNVGYKSDGTPEQTFLHDGSPNPVLLFVGPLPGGLITLPDGSRYDTTDEWIECQTLDHAELVSHFLGVQREETGRQGRSLGFVHSCGRCEELGRTPPPQLSLVPPITPEPESTTTPIIPQPGV